jgi:hypothetical protein
VVEVCQASEAQLDPAEAWVTPVDVVVQVLQEPQVVQARPVPLDQQEPLDLSDVLDDLVQLVRPDRLDVMEIPVPLVSALFDIIFRTRN